MYVNSNQANLKKPKRIPVKIVWDAFEKRLVLVDSKSEKVKTLYCDSSLSLYYDENIYDGRVEMSRYNYPESHGYYFLYDGEKELRFPLTNEYYYLAWVDEYDEPILFPEIIDKMIKLYR